MSRVTVLSSDVATTRSLKAMVTEEDETMKELLLRYDFMRDKYRTRKGQKPQDKPKKSEFLILCRCFYTLKYFGLVDNEAF